MAGGGHPWQGSGQSCLCCIPLALSRQLHRNYDWHWYHGAKYSSDAYVVHHCSCPTSCFMSRHMFTPTLVAALLKRRNITPPFHVDKVADCSLHLPANVAHFLTNRGCWYTRAKGKTSQAQKMHPKTPSHDRCRCMSSLSSTCSSGLLSVHSHFLSSSLSFFLSSFQTALIHLSLHPAPLHSPSSSLWFSLSFVFYFARELSLRIWSSPIVATFSHFLFIYFSF